MRLFLLFLASLAAVAQEPVHFAAQDGWVIYGDLYGRGARAVLLAPGGRFEKSSWGPLAKALAEEGVQVLAIDLRGKGMSKDGPAEKRTDIATTLDLLAAVRFLRGNGARQVAVVGAGSSGNLVEEAIRVAQPGEIDRAVFLAHGAFGPPHLLKLPKLFVVARNDLGAGNIPRLQRIQEQYDKAPDPKELLVLDGDAHAQYLFESNQGERLTKEMVRFLTAR